MNLVQINERLKDLPMQVIQQYANGMNPEVPPYLALGELQRREIAQKQMATAQGAQQGPQPSIKEQVEQKAGLMQLQQMQQQQMQQMQQPRGPMPVPAGVPQPQMQPEIAMARGGLAGIPVRRDMFEYAGGGIIAFQTGGQSLNERAARQMQEKGSIYDPFFGLPPEERKRKKEMADLQAAIDRSNQSMAVTESNVQALAETARARISDLEQNREELTRKFGPRMYEQALNRAQQAVDTATTRGSELIAEQANRGQERITAATPPPEAPYGSKFAPVNPADMMGSSAGLPGALAKVDPTSADRTAPPRPVAQPPAAIPPAAPTGLPSAIKAQSPLMDEALALAREKPTAPTAEGIIAEQRKLMPAGMQDEARQKMLADQRARAEERKATFERTKPSGLDDAIRVFGQSGQFKGGTGFAPAYTANQDRKRAQELAFQKEQDELLTAIDTRSSAFDGEVFGSREKSMTAATNAYQARLLGNTKALADLAGVDQRRMDEAAGRLTQMQVAKLREATANKPTEAERIEANYMALIAKDKPEEAEAYLNRISRIKGGGTAGVGSARNRILERRQEMQELSTMAKNEMGQFSDEAVKFAVDRIEKLARENAKDDSDSGATKTMSQEDVVATAKASGKTPQQVIDAAKARGFTIQ